MNFLIIFRLAKLIIRFFRIWPRFRRIVRLNKNILKDKDAYEISIFILKYFFLLAIILFFYWIISNGILFKLLYFNDAKVLHFFNSKTAIFSFLILFLISILPVKYFKKYFIALFLISLISFILSFHIVGSCYVSLFSDGNFPEVNFSKKRSGRSIPILSVLYYWTCFASPLALFATFFNFMTVWFMIKNK